MAAGSSSESLMVARIWLGESVAEILARKHEYGAGFSADHCIGIRRVLALQPGSHILSVGFDPTGWGGTVQKTALLFSRSPLTGYLRTPISVSVGRLILKSPQRLVLLLAHGGPRIRKRTEPARHPNSEPNPLLTCARHVRLGLRGSHQGREH